MKRAKIYKRIPLPHIYICTYLRMDRGLATQVGALCLTILDFKKA